MTPITLIIAGAVIGFLIWGWRGAVFGGIGGQVVSWLIGLVLWAISGSLVPRKVRQTTAADFLSANRPLVEACVPAGSDSQMLKYIESQIERLFRQASDSAPLPSPTQGMSLPEVVEAGRKISEEETSSPAKALMDALTVFVSNTMYDK